MEELQSLNRLGIIEVDLCAFFIHQLTAVLQGHGLEHPVGVAGRRDHQTVVLIVGQLLGGLHQFVPGFGRLVRIQARFTEHVLVVEHDDGRALEWNAPDLAFQGAVSHQGRVKAFQPILAGGVLGHIAKGFNQALFDQIMSVQCTQHRQLHRLACTQGRQGTHTGFVVIAGVHGFHFDFRVLGLVVLDHSIDHIGQRTTHGNGVIHGQFHRAMGVGAQAHQQGAGGGKQTILQHE